MARTAQGALAVALLSGAFGAAPAGSHHRFTGFEPGAAGASSKQALSGGTLMLNGAMTSRAQISMTGAFSVGHAASLTWDLPRPRSLYLNGYRQTVTGLDYRFSVRPGSQGIAVVQGNPVTRFVWNAPPANTVIHVVETLRVTVSSALGAFHSNAAFPMTRVPSFVEPYLGVTRSLHLFAHGRALAARLVRGRHSEQQAVDSIANWVASHLRYDMARVNGPFRASWVLAHRDTTCRGYANAMAALLRYDGIPAQVEYGLVSAQPIHVAGPHGISSSIQWGSGAAADMHAWLHIYFPGAGWVPFDPEHEKFFIDPRHIAFNTYPDARTPHTGTWSAVPIGAQSVTGRLLSDGYPEIVPADGIASQISVRSHDDFHARMDAIRHDVTGVVLLSR